MSFQNLRVGSILYIIHKEAPPRVEKAQILSVSAPYAEQPPIPVTQPNYQLGNNQYPTSQETLVNIQAKIGDAPYTYQKLPALRDVVDFGNNMVGCCTKDAVIAELTAFRQISQDALNMQSYHEAVVEGCDKVMLELNPEIAERQRQEEENKRLRGEVAELKGMVAELLNSLNGNATKN